MIHRIVLITLSLLIITVLLIIPLAAVFVEALKQGIGVYIASIVDADALAAIRLTLLDSMIVVSINTFFGLMAAWAITKFRFAGKSILSALLDLPFAISPVIVGLMLVLLFGSNSFLGRWLNHYDIQIIFALPGIVLATLFVTFPFVARQLIPLMQSQSTDDEEAARSLGASGWKTFFYVTLPNIKWGLIYGVILCNARAMGEFGAVSVVSGHIRGRTNTLPLHVEVLYNEYHFSSAFAVASLLTFLAVVTLIIKSVAEWKIAKERQLNS